MKEVVKFDGEQASAVLAKHLFMHDKKHKENMWLIVAGVDTEIDLKALTKQLGVSSGNLRAADKESLGKYLGGFQGGVNFYSIVNDTNRAVKVIYDKFLFESEWQSFHPMDNTGSTCIK